MTDDYGPICCKGECCGPGSYCCGHPDNIHEHTEEDLQDMSERDDQAEQGFHFPVPSVKLVHPAKKEHEEIDHVMEAERGLDYMLGLQARVESEWGRLVDPGDPEAVSAYIRDVVLCATDELHEVLGEVNWKPWKDSRGIKDLDKYREEMADVLHFILDLYLAAGLSGRDIIVDYLAKHTINLARVRSSEYRAS